MEELLYVLAMVLIVVIPLLVLTTFYVVPRERFSAVRSEYRSRTVAALPSLLLLGAVLAFNARFRAVARDISWWIGFEITHVIIRIEGHTVARFQELVGGEYTFLFFTFMYVHGYVFLLVFPLIAYYFLPSLNVFKGLAVAYAVNYGVGFILYIIFIAFGPRNIIPEHIGEMMHLYYPQLQLLTTEVNEFTNVFPSLHTSLSATVILFAWHTRDAYDRWVPIATFVGVSIIIATMYLAIHWIVDVVAGLGLAGVSYWIGIQAIEKGWFQTGRLSRAWSRVVGLQR